MSPSPLRLAMVVLLVVAACSGRSGEESDGVGVGDGDCPVTLPPEPGLVPPAPYPAQPASVENSVWYGTPKLWTALATDGSYLPRKSVWWSADFAGGREEPMPDISVTWRRRDVSAPALTGGGPGTNAYTAEDGWFMIAGIDPETSGCWEVTARSRDAQLSYVYLLR